MADFDVTGLQNVVGNREKSSGGKIQVKLIEGVFTPVQKQDMVRELTETMVSMEGANMRPVTWCMIEERGLHARTGPEPRRTRRKLRAEKICVE